MIWCSLNFETLWFPGVSKVYFHTSQFLTFITLNHWLPPAQLSVPCCHGFLSKISLLMFLISDPTLFTCHFFHFPVPTPFFFCFFSTLSSFHSFLLTRLCCFKIHTIIHLSNTRTKIQGSSVFFLLQTVLIPYDLRADFVICCPSS